MVQHMNNVHFAIPEIYGETLSYYELLRKLVDKTNDLIDNYNTVPEQIAEEVKNLDASQLFSAVLNQLIHSIATDNTKSANAVKVYKKHDLLYAAFNETVNLYESLIDFTTGTETELIPGTNIREVNISELFIELRKLIDINKNNIESIDGEILGARHSNISNMTYDTLGDRLDSMENYVTPDMFGASIEKEDNHDNIINALDYLKSKGGGTLLIPSGTYKTSPINLKGYRNIIITGIEPSFPWAISSCLKIITDGRVGLQLSEESGLGYVNEVPTWNAINIYIKHLRLDCNKKVNTGLNCNYDVFMYDVTVDNAKIDGIVFEPQTYPVILEQVKVIHSGRNGLYVKAPYTTCYTLKDCEFSENDGYGLYIEDGNTCVISNVILQSNKRGGLKIEKKDPSLYEHNIFLGNLTFIGVYTENNGTLSSSDAEYEGNHALYITGYDLTSYVNTNKIQNLSFINCSFNYPLTGNMGVIESVGESFNFIGESLSSIIDTEKCGTIFATNSTTVIDKINNNNDVYEVCEVKYFDKTKNIRSFIGDGYIGKRGRMRELHFHLPNKSISAGETVMMETLNPAYFYPVLQSGTLYGINILQGVKPSNGKLTFKIKYGYKSSASGGFNEYVNIDENLVIDSTTNYISLNFPLLKYNIDKSFIIGVEVTASADYVPSSSDNYTYLMCELFLES